jgi:hypothetical protein
MITLGGNFIRHKNFFFDFVLLIFVPLSQKNFFVHIL